MQISFQDQIIPFTHQMENLKGQALDRKIVLYLKRPDDKGAFPDNQCLLLDHVTPLLCENSPENPNSTKDENLLKPLVTAKTRSDSVKLPVVSVSFK